MNTKIDWTSLLGWDTLLPSTSEKLYERIYHREPRRKHTEKPDKDEKQEYTFQESGKFVLNAFQRERSTQKKCSITQKRKKSRKSKVKLKFLFLILKFSQKKKKENSKNFTFHWHFFSITQKEKHLSQILSTNIQTQKKKKEIFSKYKKKIFS